MSGNATAITISARQANLFSLAVFFGTMVVYGVPFSFIWNAGLLFQAFKNFLTNYGTLAITLLLGIVIHELLHGITWAIFCKNGMKSIRFGVNWLALSAYAHCTEPLPINRYKLGGAMPGVILGILPGILSIVTGNGWLLMTGMFFTAGAAGDLLVLHKLSTFKNTAIVQDHPDEIGFLVYHE